MKAYAILFIDVATEKVVRGQFAAGWPVTGKIGEIQVLLLASPDFESYGQCCAWLVKAIAGNPYFDGARKFFHREVPS